MNNEGINESMRSFYKYYSHILSVKRFEAQMQKLLTELKAELHG